MSLPVSKKALVLAGAVGVGVVAARRRAAARGVDNPVPEPLPATPPPPVGRNRTVLTEDGVELSVVEHGAQDAPTATVVLAHGYVQSSKLWNGQVRDLVDTRPDLKVVTYDHRGHGRSGRTPREKASIAQLGRDMARVIDAVAPAGPVVVAGHSMGGMTIMALADAHPELFGTRVVAVGLISTSTGRLAELTFGLPKAVLPVSRRVLPFLTRGMRSRPQHFERGRRVVGTDLAFLVTRFGGFGDREVSPALVHFVEQMAAQTPVDVIAEFYDTFTTHDKLAALGVLRDVETLVLVGSKDLVTPVDHSSAMADALADAHLVVVEGAGHMVLLERPALVTLQLRALIARATRSAARSA